MKPVGRLQSLLLTLLALGMVHWYVRQPSKPRAVMTGYGEDWLTHCRNGGAA